VPSGIRYHSFLESSGYGLAGIAYVRGLVNAGVAVHWNTLLWQGGAVASVRAGDAIPLLAQIDDDAALRDLPALIEATSRSIACDTVVAHTVPEHWPALFEPGRRNVGYTVLETDAPPPHWGPLLDRAAALCVPCRMNRTSLEAAGVRAPLHVIPHIKRHGWNEFMPSELAALRAQLGIPGDHFIFYTIGTWDPRKALPLLLHAFVHAFTADDPVTLVVKTQATGFGPPPFYPLQPTTDLAAAVIDGAAADAGHAAPSICLLPFELTGRGIDMLHEIGNHYVSLAHGEGWALCAFDAATRGTPVTMTGWGGHLDYLGADWPGAVACGMTSVPIWPPYLPSLWPPQRWSAPDFAAAVTALRRAFGEPGAGLQAAATIQEEIANRYAEPVVTRQYLAAIHG